jgi:hypothetical protein
VKVRRHTLARRCAALSADVGAPVCLPGQQRLRLEIAGAEPLPGHVTSPGRAVRPDLAVQQPAGRRWPARRPGWAARPCRRSRGSTSRSPAPAARPAAPPARRRHPPGDAPGPGRAQLAARLDGQERRAVHVSRRPRSAESALPLRAGRVPLNRLRPFRGYSAPPGELAARDPVSPLSATQPRRGNLPSRAYFTLLRAT